MHVPSSANKVSKLEKETAVTTPLKIKKRDDTTAAFFYPLIVESDEKYYFCEVIF
jgi:hypothetical protein